MNLIAAVDLVNGIGKNNNLLYTLKDDLKRFKAFTINKTIVMGSKTFESLPSYPKPLPNRLNVILTSNPSKYASQQYNNEKLIFTNDIFNVVNFKDSDVWIIGGESIYKQYFQYCEFAYITRVYNNFKANKFLIPLNIYQNWELILNSNIKSNEILIGFEIYKNWNVANI